MGVLLKSQYKTRFTNGGELRTQKGHNFRGYYIHTTNGKFFEGSSAQDQGARLYPKGPSQKGGATFTPYDALKPKIHAITQLRDPVSTKPSPTASETKKGMFIRYFFIDIRTKNFSETSKEEYQKRAEIDLNIFKFYKIGWWINSLYQDRNSNSLKSLEKLGHITLDIYEYSSTGDDIPNDI